MIQVFGYIYNPHSDDYGDFGGGDYDDYGGDYDDILDDLDDTLGDIETNRRVIIEIKYD